MEQCRGDGNYDGDHVIVVLTLLCSRLLLRAAVV